MTVEEVKRAQATAWRAESELYGECLTRQEASVIGVMSGTVDETDIICTNVEVADIVKALDRGVQGREFRRNEVKDDNYALGIGKHQEAYRYGYHNPRIKPLKFNGYAPRDDIIRAMPEAIVFCNAVEDDYGPKGKVWPGMVVLRKK